MSDSAAKQFLVKVEGEEVIGPIEGKKGDVTFPPQVRGWGDVLDARHKPYTEKELPAILHFAKHVHKPFVLVFEDRLPSSAAVKLEG